MVARSNIINAVDPEHQTQFCGVMRASRHSAMISLTVSHAEVKANLANKLRNKSDSCRRGQTQRVYNQQVAGASRIYLATFSGVEVRSKNNYGIA